MRKLILLLIACVSCGAAMAQVLATGRIIDGETGDPLVAANVKVLGTKTIVQTDASGHFSIPNVRKGRQLTATYIGYKSTNANVPADGKLGDIAMEPQSTTLASATVTASMGVDRHTPVALSNIQVEDLELKLGGQEFPEIMKTTPGVHINKQGGGYGDSEIYMRGFDNTNVATMINGVPMNDMENGTVYWSNWAGLSDVTRRMQTQRGLGASKVSAPSVGGTINILTNTLEEKRGGTAVYQYGNDNTNKVSLSLNTGMTKSGWAASILFSRNWGDGYVQGTDFTSYTWFASVAKKFNDHHTLSFTAFGSPQVHGQRTSSYNYGPLTIAEWARIEKEYGVKNHRYNPQFGYFHGEEYNVLQNRYHKPQLSLNHDWTIDDKSKLSTALYMSIGRGGGATAETHGSVFGSYSDIYGAYHGQVRNTYRTADGYFDYDAIYNINASSQEGSYMAICEQNNNHLWTGILSTYSNKLTKWLDFYGGLDLRYYRGDHDTRITDLFGGSYFIDDYDRAGKNATNHPLFGDPNWTYQKLGVGDKVFRDNSGYVMQEGIFGQFELQRGDWSAFLSGAVNNTDYWRIERYYQKDARSGNVNFWGGNIKAGANYNINSYHNVFMNVGYISRAPKFNNTFLSSNYSNLINKDAVNEKILSIELGYGFRWDWGNVKLNGYYTNWMDKSVPKYLSGVGPTQGNFYVNMNGVDARHMGIEFETVLRPAKWVDIKGMFSYGDWRWNSVGEGYVYTERGEAVDANGATVSPGSPEHAKAIIDLKDIRVGGSAQTTASIGADFKIGKSIRLGGDWVYYGRNYSYYSLNGDNISVGKTTTIADPWKIPSAYQLDLHASYKFDIVKGIHATISGNVNNLLNNQYIGKAYNSSTSTGAATADNVYVFYQHGRTYSIRLKLNF